MKIRKAKKEDLKKIAKIFREEAGKKPYESTMTSHSSVKKISEYFGSQDVYVAVVDNDIVGFSVSGIIDTDKNKVFLHELWFKPGHQGKGIGTHLLGFLEERYKEKGIVGIELMTRRKAKSYDFYKKLKYGDSDKTAFMEKRL